MLRKPLWVVFFVIIVVLLCFVVFGLFFFFLLNSFNNFSCWKPWYVLTKCDTQFLKSKDKLRSVEVAPNEDLARDLKTDKRKYRPKLTSLLQCFSLNEMLWGHDIGIFFQEDQMQEINRHAKSASQVIRVSELCCVLLQSLSFCFGKTSECRGWPCALVSDECKQKMILLVWMKWTIPWRRIIAVS